MNLDKMTNSNSAEDYLKTIFILSRKTGEIVQTNTIAAHIGIKPASVTDMLKKLAEKKLIDYTRYKGVSLTDTGMRLAAQIIRKHRLWEVFLVNTLHFKWDEVHEIAEELEHINSEALIDRLDKFLGEPKTDPHGDPIPDANGNLPDVPPLALNQLDVCSTGIIIGVSEHSSTYLRHLETLGLTLGKKIQIMEIMDFDGSIALRVENRTINISRDVAKHILIHEEF